MALAQQAPTPALTQAYAVLKPQVTRGLIGDYPDVGWVIQSPFALTVGTVVPATTLRFAGATASFSGPAIGIQPMAQVTVTTPLTLTVLGWSVKDNAWKAIDLDARLIDVGMQQSSSPDALWSKNSFDPDGIPQAKSIPGTILGATLQGSQVLRYAPVGPMDMASLAFVKLGPLPLPFAWTPNYPAQAEPLQTDRAKVIASTIMDPLVVLLRNDILAALRLFGQPALEAPNLSVLQHNVGNIFQSPPSIAPLGMDLAPVITASTTLAQSAPRVAAEAPAVVNASRVIGHSRRYRAGGTRHALGKGDTALQLMRYRSRAKWVAGLGQFAAKVAGTLHLTLAPGATSIVRLGDDAARRVELRGNLALRLLAFNCYEEPLQLRIADPACGAYHELPAATSELVVIAGDASPDGVAGWYHDSDWTRLNHYYFQADGCLLRPEAAPVLKNLQRGQILASDVLRGNQVRQADGSLGQGWLETLFFEHVSTVAVLVGGSVRPRVQARWTDDPANPAYAGDDDLDPQFVLQAGALQVYVYQVPDCLDDKLGLALLVHGRDTACYRSPASASVQGVFGFCADAATLKSGGLSGLMQCAAGAPADTACAARSGTDPLLLRRRTPAPGRFLLVAGAADGRRAQGRCEGQQLRRANPVPGERPALPAAISGLAAGLSAGQYGRQLRGIAAARGVAHPHLAVGQVDRRQHQQRGRQRRHHAALDRPADAVSGRAQRRHPAGDHGGAADRPGRPVHPGADPDRRGHPQCR
ncbi:MAG: hypothetical protein NTY28_02450, partial [Janthinobacterium sp.]|nr:hypothetical protein [Janthinobacterium sp.]